MKSNKRVQNIYLIRHAESEDREIAQRKKKTDASRALTSKGLNQCKQLRKKLKKIFLKTDLFVSSPFVRARQTYEHLVKDLPPEFVRYRELDFILPDSEPTECLNWLKRQSAEQIILVSHEPFLSELSHRLLKLEQNMVEFKKAGCLYLRWSPALQQYQICAF